MAQIYEVTSVTARLKFVFTPGPPVSIGLKLSVNANGLTRTTGWTSGRLIPRSQLPGSTMKIFDFEATPPGGISGQMITPITAREWVGSFSALTRTVTVYSETNKIIVDITGPIFNLAQAALAAHNKAPKAAKAPAKKKALPAKKVKVPPKKKTSATPGAKKKAGK